MKIISSILLLLFCTSLSTAQTSDVHVKLSLAEPKPVYRIGEQIKMVMEFTADSEGYLIDYFPDQKQPFFDTLVVSPEGITRWLSDLTDNLPSMRCVVSEEKLTSSPRRVELILNDTLRFETSGRYTVRVTTRRVWRRPGSRAEPLELSTNPITIQVQEMSEADEAKEVKRLSDLLDTKRDVQTDEEVGRQLSYLTGDPSAREKVRRFLARDQRAGNYSSHMWYGLFIARNRSLVLKLLESAMRDPATPVASQMLHTVTRLKMLLTYGANGEWPKRAEVDMLQPKEDPRALEITDAYILELSSGLSERTGESQTTTAITIMTSLPKDAGSSTVAMREARRILVQQFDTLHPYSQEWLLRAYWDQLLDPSLIPALKKLLATSDPKLSQVHAAALDRLIDMVPGEASSYVLAEIRNIHSLVNLEILGRIEAKSLPEVDTFLMDQIRQLSTSAQGRDRILLEHKAFLLARFATASLYQPVMQLYQEMGDKFSLTTRAGLLAYLAKHNEREAVPLIEQTLSNIESNQTFTFLGDLTKAHYSESIGGLLKKILETNEPARASHAAYLIGKYGAPGDERLLEARLNRWYEEWRQRTAEADSQLQGQIERELIYALVNGKSWKLSPERVRELKTGCITKMCQQSNPTQ